MYPPLGFVKLIVGPPGDDRMLGVRVVGRDADTLVAAASIMIERQLPYSYLMESILPHPSLMECLQGAAHIIAGDALSYEQGEEYDFGSMAGYPASSALKLGFTDLPPEPAKQPLKVSAVERLGNKAGQPALQCRFADFLSRISAGQVDIRPVVRR